MKCFIVTIGFLLAFDCLHAQKVGINTTDPEAALDVNGDLILRTAELTLSNGLNVSVNVNANPFSSYRINGPTASFIVAGISAATDGKLVSFANTSGQYMTITHEDINALEADRIVIENESFLHIPPNASVDFQYNGSNQRWMLKSHSLTSSSSSSPDAWSLNGNNGTTNNNFIGTLNNEPVTIKSFNNTVALFQHGYPSNNYIGTNYQRTGIGLLGQTSPVHTLEVGLADLNGGSVGVLGLRGTQFMTHFNYGNEENTIIRAGKTEGKILLNDLNGLGNVGIGLEYPFYKLHVNGNGKFKSNESLIYGEGQQGGYYFSAGAIQWSSPNLDNYPPGIEENYMIADGNKLQTFVKSIDDPSISDYSRSLSINPYGGNIGIGTLNPIANSKVTLQTDDSYNIALTIKNPSSSAVFQTFVGGPDNGNTISLGTPGAMPIALYTNSANRLFIAANGNIGIGIDGPQEKLSVNGTIRSKEVIVESINWPDYVFDEKYTLTPLVDLEKYINTYHHLPNIPSSKEVESKGQSLGDIQKKMMEKIEELTLYIIEQDKKLNEFESKLNSCINTKN